MAALPAYRHLVRAARVAFQGDQRVLTAARASIRDSFRTNAALEPSDPKTAEAIQHAEEVAAILRRNIVQGRKEGGLYKLRIHEETERGDNDTVKMPNGQNVKIDGKTCSDR